MALTAVNLGDVGEKNRRDERSGVEKRGEEERGVEISGEEKRLVEKWREVECWYVM